MIFDARRPRFEGGPTLAGYPPTVRRLILWFDGLSDWQRVQYAVAAMLFLLACSGYLLGLGSTMVLQRVEMETALAAARVPTAVVEVTATPQAMLALAIEGSPTTSTVPRPSATSTAQPTATPEPTLFTTARLSEPPAVPRSVPEIIAPAAPAAARPTSTPDRPRNVETVPPAAATATALAVRRTPGTPTTGRLATAVIPGRTTNGTPGPGETGSPGGAVTSSTPHTGTGTTGTGGTGTGGAAARATPLPTLALPPTRAPASGTGSGSAAAPTHTPLLAPTTPAPAQQSQPTPRQPAATPTRTPTR